jgi:hypothetical protein
MKGAAHALGGGRSARLFQGLDSFATRASKDWTHGK